MTPPKGSPKWFFWENTFLLFFRLPESPRNDSLRVKMCLECVHVCQTGSPFNSEGLFSGGSEGSLFGPFSAHFLKHPSIFVNRSNVMKIGIWAFLSFPKVLFLGLSEKLIFDGKKLPDALYIGISAIFGISEKTSLGVKF